MVYAWVYAGSRGPIRTFAPGVHGPPSGSRGDGLLEGPVFLIRTH